MSSWIKLHRSLLKWEWYADTNTKCVFIHFLLSANYEPKKWQGIEVKRGQLIIGLHKLSDELNISIKCIRTSLKKLINSNEILVKGTNKFSIVTVCNYDSYQEKEIIEDKQGANKGQSKGKQRATPKEYKKERSKEDIYISPEFQNLQTWIKENAPRVNEMKEPLSQKQYEKLIDKFTLEAIKNKLLVMHNWKKITNSVSTYLTFLNWMARDGNTFSNPEPKQNTPPKKSTTEDRLKEEAAIRKKMGLDNTQS